MNDYNESFLKSQKSFVHYECKLSELKKNNGSNSKVQRNEEKYYNSIHLYEEKKGEWLETLNNERVKWMGAEGQLMQ